MGASNIPGGSGLGLAAVLTDKLGIGLGGLLGLVLTVFVIFAAAQIIGQILLTHVVAGEIVGVLVALEQGGLLAYFSLVRSL